MLGAGALRETPNVNEDDMFQNSQGQMVVHSHQENESEVAQSNYNIVLVLPYIDMNLPQVYTCSPS